VVTGSAEMMGAQASHVAQVWRLSDLRLISTVPLPAQADWYNDAAADSSEPRVLADGKTGIGMKSGALLVPEECVEAALKVLKGLGLE